MAIPIIMPKFSMTQEEATVMVWLVAEGDIVEKRDPLMEVETDKVTMEVEAPEDGVLRGVKVGEGDVVPVTEVIGYIVPEGEVWSPEPEIVETAVSTLPAIKATPVARRVAAAAAIDVKDILLPTHDHKIRRQHVEQHLRQQQITSPGNSDYLPAAANKARATPAARRLARERGLPLAQLTGSGRRGRIQAVDVGFQLPAAVASVPSMTGDEILPLSRIRRTIADRMVASYQSIPHFTLTVAADMTAVLDLRQRLNAQVEKEGTARVSVTAVLAKVCAWALGQHPLVNASWGENSIQLHQQANIGVAVALDDGLIVPVIQNVAALGLAEIAQQLQDMTAQARNGRLQPQDVQDGTFTISNLGMLGIDQFTAIINPPQSAILAVGRTVKKPVVVETPTGEDELLIRPMMKMTLSVDHRTVDGVVAAHFLQDVVAGLEQPDRLLW